jgi:thiol-disulfide isomerase/thioredoxin
MFANKYFKYFLLFLLYIHFSTKALASKIIDIDNLNAPDEVVFFDVNGEKCFLDQFEGKTILLSFWATWCSSCVKEIPELDWLQKDFRKLPFEIVAVSQDFQGVGVVKEFFKTQEIRHLKIYHDYQNQLFKAFSVVGLPTSFLINHKGKVVKSFTGIINWYDSEIRNIILFNVPGNPEIPKNSYKVQDLNKSVKSKIQESNEKSTQHENKDPKITIPIENNNSTNNQLGTIQDKSLENINGLKDEQVKQ